VVARHEGVGKSVRDLAESLAIWNATTARQIRELENVVERAICWAADFLSPESLPPQLRAPRNEQTVNVRSAGMDLEGT